MFSKIIYKVKYQKWLIYKNCLEISKRMFLVKDSFLELKYRY